MNEISKLALITVVLALMLFFTGHPDKINIEVRTPSFEATVTPEKGIVLRLDL